MDENEIKSVLPRRGFKGEKTTLEVVSFLTLKMNPT